MALEHTAPSLSSTFTGRVAAVNPKGIRLDGHENWFNISRFAPDVVLPERGETVTVNVDSKGFLRSCEPIGSAPDGSAGTPPPAAPGGHDRDRTITRLAVLKAAAEFGAARPELKSGDVLTIAESWEIWVLRDR